MFEQDRVIVRLQQLVNRESSILACLLTGSYGRRAEDAFADLDVILLFADSAQREVAWERRREFIQSVLPYISAKSFDADHVRPFLHIALYSNGAKVDYRFETQEELKPNFWDKDVRILKDNRGWAEQFQAASAAAPKTMPRISNSELERLDNRFWVMFWDIYRLLLRGDHDKPFTIYLELLQFTLPPILRVLPSEEPTRQGLLKASFSRDTRGTVRELVQLFDAYVAARAAVVSRLRLSFTPDLRYESALRGLLRKKL